MTLKELQKQITPLPWRFNGTSKRPKAKSYIQGGADRFRQIAWLSEYGEPTEADSSYLIHTANNFGPLVEALNQCLPVMVRSACGDSGINHQQAAQDCSEIIRKALATAETVKDL